MPNPENIFAPFSMSTSAIPGSIGSAVSGFGVGASQAGRASSLASEDSELISQRDSLLQALDILAKGLNDLKDDNPAGLDLFPDDLKYTLNLIHNSAASIAGSLLLAPSMMASHLAQLPLDVRASLEGILHSINDYKQFTQTRQASTLEMDDKLREQHDGFSANCAALHKNFNDILDELKKHIVVDAPKESATVAVDVGNKASSGAVKTHENLAKSSGVTAAVGSLGVAGLASFMVDVLGSTFREMSALVLFSKQESTNPKEKNVYLAFSECCHSFSNSNNSEESFRALLKLEKALSDFGPAMDMSDEHHATSPIISVLLRLITAEPFMTLLKATNASALALSEAHHVMSLEQGKFSQNIHDSGAKASLLKDFCGGDALNHSQNVSEFCHHFDQAIAKIDEDIKKEEDANGKNDKNRKIIANSAKSTVRSDSALIIASSLITGLVGMLSREFSGTIDFSQHDKGSRKESNDVLQTRPDMTGADMDMLLSRVCDLHDRLKRCNELGVSAPVVMGVGEAITSGALIGSLNVVAGMFSALHELRTLVHNPSILSDLKEEELVKAKENADSMIASNKKSAKSMGTAPVSDNLSLHQQIESVMKTVVLIHRSHDNFLNPDMERNELNRTGKSTIVFSQGNSTGFLLGSLGVLALIGLQSGIGIEALFGGLRYSLEAKKLSGGVDRTDLPNGSRTNISFPSNATRFIGKSLDEFSITQTSSQATYRLAESVMSRSLLVSLCHSGALKEMLTRLIAEEGERLIHVPGNLDSVLESHAMMPHLEAQILKVLDDAEANQKPIPGLNADMASNLGFATKASIAAVISTHSAFIAPFLKSILAAKRASVIPDEMRQEALVNNSETSQIISTALNIIQAFSLNSALEMEKIEKLGDPIKKDMSVIKTADSATFAATLASCGVSLVCDELMELCLGRSLTLLNQNKVKDSYGATLQQAQQDSAFSRDAVAADSGLGQEHSVTHAISALRLTLSHLGASLGDFASELDASANVLDDNLHMHSMQQSLIKSMQSSFMEASSAALYMSAVLSNLPLSSVGIVDILRETVHSIDHQLVLRPMHSSENSVRDCESKSTLLTAIGTDCVSSIVSAMIKILLQASVLGLDTALSIAKLMEILSLNPRPEEALALEFQDLSQPNGLMANLNEHMQSISVVGGLGAAISVAATKTGDSAMTVQSMRSLQAAVDHRIEQVALLEDEEEGDSLGLKAFYEILIRILADRKQNNESFFDVVNRFNRGGYALSGYHSDHGGVLGIHRQRVNSDSGFKKCDDAMALLNMFIHNAIQTERNAAQKEQNATQKERAPESLLTKVKQELLGQKQLSSKSRDSWEHLVSKVMNRMKLEDTRNSVFSPGSAMIKKRNWDERKNDLLTNWALDKSEYEEINSPALPM